MPFTGGWSVPELGDAGAAMVENRRHLGMNNTSRITTPKQQNRQQAEKIEPGMLAAQADGINAVGLPVICTSMDHGILP